MSPSEIIGANLFIDGIVSMLVAHQNFQKR